MEAPIHYEAARMGARQGIQSLIGPALEARDLPEGHPTRQAIIAQRDEILAEFDSARREYVRAATAAPVVAAPRHHAPVGASVGDRRDLDARRDARRDARHEAASIVALDAALTARRRK